ncbi:hypothetical protein CEXT_623851 [Caerostris extrusa]|uniref:Uncharacterized protein n=1 Tax=Caerostris extrusa TaxID=172846 RepID=A0AAV4RJZ6_CAEEX|nr:hypothetical protein CEXT_623851 [Caerostris extrusa]
MTLATAFIIDDYIQFDLNALLNTHPFPSYRSSVEGDGEERRRKGASRGLSVQQRSGEQRSLDGSTLKSDWSKRESTLLESAEGQPQGHPDCQDRRTGTPTSAVSLLLCGSAEERYEGLTREAGGARTAGGGARRVRRRRVRGQEKRAQISGSNLDAAGEEAGFRAEHRRCPPSSVTRAQDEAPDRGGWAVRTDFLDRRRRDAEERLAKLDEEHDAALSLARQNLRAKYQRLQDSLTCRDVSEAVVDMSRAQQAAALTQRQRSTVETQDRYRKAVALYAPARRQETGWWSRGRPAQGNGGG